MPADRRSGLFAETPRARRRLVSLLYAAVGPVFLAVLALLELPATAPAGACWAAGLILGGGAWMALFPGRGALAWVFPGAVVPIACCAIAFTVTGAEGGGYLAVMGAPLAWCAVLFEAPVVWAALAASIAACFTVVTLRFGAVPGVATTVLFATISGLVAWVVFRTAEGLRAARAAVLRAGARDRFLTALVGTMEDAVVVTDAQLRVLDYTGRARDIYGWEPEEILGKSLAADFTTEFPDGDEARVAAAVAAGTPVRARVRARRKDGTWRDLDLSATALRDEAGAVTGWLSVARDIGAQVAAERGLREALLSVKTLSGLLPICMYCKRIRDDQGYWQQVESYVRRHTDARFSHGMCPDCEKKNFPEGG